MIEIEKYIDHTNLKSTTTKSEIIKFFEDVGDIEFASICIAPVWVPLAINFFKNKNKKIKICTVIGFPLGYQTTASKAFEALELSREGVDEIDMVWNIGMCKSGEEEFLLDEIKHIKEIIKRENPNIIFKVIIEACLLTEEEKIMACRVIKKAGADFIKTSTGFEIEGAKIEDIKLFKEQLKETNIKIKASGKISTYEDAVLLINAGADRIGTSKGLEIYHFSLKLKK